MATLPEPPGQLFVGAQGSWNKRSFTVLGRVRYGWEQGCWDEWYVLFDDGTPRWISEDEGHLTLETFKQLPKAPRSYEEMRAGQWIKLGKQRFHIDEKNIATCEGGEGQLPFMIEPGEQVKYLEMTSEEQHGTIEFEEGGGCKVFVGSTIDYRDLQLAHTASELGIAEGSLEQAAGAGQRERIVKSTARSLNLNCPACGSSIGIPEPGIEAMSCPACATTIDLAAEAVACPNCGGGVQIHGAAKMAVCNHCSHQLQLSGGEPKLLAGALGTQRPKFPLTCGQRGTLDGTQYHVVGILRYEEKDGVVRYHTDEFLLFNKEKGYRWLIRYEGHWNLADKLKGPPPGLKPKHSVRRQKFHYQGQNWKVFERGKWKTTWVEGELPWVAHVGDESYYMDAVAPPLMLSAEWTANEVEWHQSTYMQTDEVAQAFNIKLLQRRKGIGANQPFLVSPFRQQAAWAMLIFACLHLLLAVGSCTSEGTRIAQFTVPPDEYSGKEYLTPGFEVTSGSSLCYLRAESPVNNQWVYLEMAVVDEKDKALIELSQEMSYYHGVQGGESWSEGSKNDGKMFKLEEPGTYRLLMTGSAGHGNQGKYPPGAGTNVTVSVYQDSTLLRYYVIFFIIGLCWAGWEWGRRGMFEAGRWAEEDD